MENRVKIEKILNMETGNIEYDVVVSGSDVDDTIHFYCMNGESAKIFRKNFIKFLEDNSTFFV